MVAWFSGYLCGCTLLTRADEPLHPAWCPEAGHDKRPDSARTKSPEPVIVDPDDTHITYGWMAQP